MVLAYVHYSTVNRVLALFYFGLRPEVRAMKDLKNVGFKWASQKKQWYWHSEAFRKRSHRTLSMEDIRSYYGSTRVNTMQMALEA